MICGPIFGSFVRHALTLVGGILVTKGVLQPEVADQMVSSATEVVTGGACYVLSQVWSVFDKKK